MQLAELHQRERHLTRAFTQGVLRQAAYDEALANVDAERRPLHTRLLVSAALELAKDGIRVNVVAPGPTLTPMLDRVTGGNVDLFTSRCLWGARRRRNEVARAIAWIASPESILRDRRRSSRQRPNVSPLIPGATRTFTIVNQEAAWQAVVKVSGVDLSHQPSLSAAS